MKGFAHGGAMIRRCRLGHGLTQKVLARRMGIWKGSLDRSEHTANVQLDTLLAVAAACEISLAEMVKRYGKGDG